MDIIQLKDRQSECSTSSRQDVLISESPIEDVVKTLMLTWRIRHAHLVHLPDVVFLPSCLLKRQTRWVGSCSAFSVERRVGSLTWTRYIGDGSSPPRLLHLYQCIDEVPTRLGFLARRASIGRSEYVSKPAFSYFKLQPNNAGTIVGKE